MGRQQVRYSPEVRERGVRLVLEHQHEHGSQWAAIQSIAPKLGCTPETLRKWVRRAERDQGRRPGPTSDHQQRMKELERENRELRRANEILRKASAFYTDLHIETFRASLNMNTFNSGQQHLNSSAP